MTVKQKDHNNPSMQEILQAKDQNTQKELYNDYVENMTPKTNT